MKKLTNPNEFAQEDVYFSATLFPQLIYVPFVCFDKHDIINRNWATRSMNDSELLSERCPCGISGSHT